MDEKDVEKEVPEEAEEPQPTEGAESLQKSTTTFRLDGATYTIGKRVTFFEILRIRLILEYDACSYQEAEVILH